MDAPSNPLPTEWVQRLFSRFQAIYGNRVTTMWGDSNPHEVQAVWAAELGRFMAEDLRGALESLRTTHPDYPPTLFQFSGLCRDARKIRAQNAVKLDYTRTPMPDHIREQFKRFLNEHRLGR